MPLLGDKATLLWAPRSGNQVWTNRVTLDNRKKPRPLNLERLEQTANCCEVVVYLVLLTQVLAAGSLVSAAGCCLLEIAMVAEIRRGLTGWQPADLDRDIAVTFKSHRRFYPASPLRRAFVASSILLGFCIAGLVMVYRIAHGM